MTHEGLPRARSRVYPGDGLSRTLVLAALHCVVLVLGWVLAADATGRGQRREPARAHSAREPWLPELVPPPRPPAARRARVLGVEAAASDSAGPAPPEPGAGATRVHGLVHRGGRPAEGFGLSFLVLAPGREPEEVDWDFTDEDGGYEVELAAGRYLVLGDGNAGLGELVVPPSVPELGLDLDPLPLGPPRRRGPAGVTPP